MSPSHHFWFAGPRVVAALLFGLLLALPPEVAQGASEVFPLEVGEKCLDCHDDLIAKAYPHSAIEDSESCTICHELADPRQHAPHRPGKKVIELCLNCHDAFVSKGSTHGPVAAGECTACHDPHSAAQPKLLRQAPPQLCFSCHNEALKDDQEKWLPATEPLFTNEKATLHPPFAGGECDSCHAPHGAAQQRLLVDAFPQGFYAKYSSATYALCLSCHDSAPFTEARTLTATAFRNGNLNLHFRHVNKEKGRSCATCHSAHGTQQKHQIIRGFMFGEKPLPLTYTPSEHGGDCLAACHGKASYDRVLPIYNNFRTTPRTGQDASLEVLRAQPEAQAAHQNPPQ